MTVKREIWQLLRTFDLHLYIVRIICFGLLMRFPSKITIVVIFVFDLFAGAFLLFLLVLVVLFRLFLADLFLIFLWLLFLSGVSSCEDAFFGFLFELSIEFFVSSEGLDLVGFLLLSDFLQFFLCFLQFFFLDSVEGFEFVFQVVQIAVLVDVGFLK